MKTNNKGFSLPELITVVVVISILGAIALAVVSNLTATARENAKAANAAALTRMVQMAVAAESLVGAGGTYDIDSTSASTAIAKMNTGFTKNNITFKMQPTITTPASYSMSGAGNNLVFSYTAGSAAAP